MDAEAFAQLRQAVGGGMKEILGEKESEDVWRTCVHAQRNRDKLTNHPSYVDLDFLAVDPQQQRRGIGKKLLAWGMEHAASEGKDCFLVATPAGKPLYLACGFEELGDIDLFGVPHSGMIIKNDARWQGS